MTAAQQFGMFLLFGSLSVMALFSIAAFWRIFEKADMPGYLSLIPIVNFFGLVKLAQKPGWWVLLLFIPVIGQIVWIMLMYNIAKSFGYGIGFTIGLLILPMFFFIFLAFEDNEFVMAA